MFVHKRYSLLVARFGIRETLQADFALITYDHAFMFAWSLGKIILIKGRY